MTTMEGEEKMAGRGVATLYGNWATNYRAMVVSAALTLWLTS